ncbi:hypothetical protein, partial [Klebsiella quasipneumoniae]|uniref:hypothetical protein n=1 Tax=Klebsiella quasipneumoniae TaxID=1463165 RepID=UPI001955260F
FQIAVLVCPNAGVQIELSKVVAHRHRWRRFFGCMLSKLQMTYIVTQINFLQPWYFLKYWH